MKKLLSVSLILCVLCGFFVLLYVNYTANSAEKTIIKSEEVNGKKYDKVENLQVNFKGKVSTGSSDVDEVKRLINKFVATNMKKYDINKTLQVNYDGIVDKKSSFYDYANKLATLTHNHYKSLTDLKVECVDYNIEYNEIKCQDDIYTVNAEVYEEKKYASQSEPGYVCTKHTFTVEKQNGEFYIIDDVTDDYMDKNMRENG